MKKKMTITEDNYKEIMLKRAIISCWIILAICLVITICGGHFFYMYCDDKTIVSICNFVDNSFIRYIIYFCYFSFEQIVMYGIVKGNINFKTKSRIYHILCICLFWGYKFLVDSNILKVSVTLNTIISAIIVILILFTFSKNIKHSIFVFIYDFILLLVFAFIKDISLNDVLTNSFLLDTIFMLDYYSALMLTYLYSKKIKSKKGGSVWEYQVGYHF